MTTPTPSPDIDRDRHADLEWKLSRVGSLPEATIAIDRLIERMEFRFDELEKRMSIHRQILMDLIQNINLSHSPK